MADAPAESRPFEVVEVSSEDTHPLRLAILRHGTPTRDVRLAEDEWPGAFHLGVRPCGEVVAVSTWVPCPCDARPGRRAIQLRGMATASSHQSRGIGGALLRAGLERAAAAGFDVVWARARDTALPFYARHHFTIVGEGFVDVSTELAHHVVVRDLR